MHINIGQQRDNWNSLLLNSINMITLTATTMVAFGAAHGTVMPLNLSSSLLFFAATGMLIVMNNMQPSQLVEEQRNATRLFKQLRGEIETLLALHVPNENDVNIMMERVLALDRTYPLPLLGGVMLEKFPKKYKPAIWWPKNKNQFLKGRGIDYEMEKNGWNEEMEMKMREIVQVVKINDQEEYERLGNIALKVNKVLAISGPVLTGVAAIGSGLAGFSPEAAVVAAVAGAAATVVNSLEHGGQVGMVFEMYRNCGGCFKLTEELIEDTLEEREIERRENGELFEMKVALKLGRSLSELSDLAVASASSRRDGNTIGEYASKLI